ncbi:cupin domain-containing protein [Roseateles toxinivorans]|uniref:Mannose-6-phosphate isomerase-like protein (Cupin superfamily) n=1 Tax=Roseateles toxinivorans TaxID=270368 RepID=A0A4R6QPC8_9BURK|nr:cupin domain-containing protein [Roseateles toxinivorans]TDP72730.1 mannose-6-phosphate isomerase-like protein (cupin superfamily) [Roseateles toxinivorans]
MLIVNHAVLPVELHRGWHSQCVAGPNLGCAGFEVRLIELDAWASSDVRVHAAERVLLVQAGSGKQRLDGEPQEFHAPCTLHVPARARHQLCNCGATPLRVVEISAPSCAAPAPCCD